MIGLLWGTILILLAAVTLCYAADALRRKDKIKPVLWFCLGLLLTLLGITPSLALSDMLRDISDAKAVTLVLLVIFGTGATMFLAVISQARSPKYNEIMGKVLGFRDFIKTAELDKINELIEDDPEYFYHIIPYAYVFGLTNRWIRKFEDIVIVQPEWIKTTASAGGDSFDAYMMGRVMSDCNASVSSNIQLHSSSGSVTGHAGSSGSSSDSSGSSWSGGGFSGEVTPAEAAEAAEAAPGKRSYNAIKGLYNKRAFSFVQANYGGDIFKTVFPRYHFQGSQ